MVPKHGHIGSEQRSVQVSSRVLPSVSSRCLGKECKNKVSAQFSFPQCVLTGPNSLAGDYLRQSFNPISVFSRF